MPIRFRLIAISLAAIAAIAAEGQTPRFDKFQDASLAKVQPKGWLKEFLMRQKSGLTGHPEAMSYPYDRPWWNDALQKEDVPEVFWWPYEQTAYYWDAATRLGLVLHDQDLNAKAKKVIDNVLQNPQRNGRLGPNLFPIQWPIAVFFRALQAEYLATSDPELLKSLHKHFSTYSVKDVADGLRHVVNIEGILWTYGLTGDRELLNTAELAYAESNRLALGGELTFDMCASPDLLDIHGVTHMEEAKLPAMLYSYTGKKKYLDAAVNVMLKVDRDHMLPDGIPSSKENLAGRDPLESHETCDITDTTWTWGYLLQATGDATWADRIERAIFNAGPGAVSKDFKQMQYFSSPNQVIATGESNHNPMFYGSTWMQYRPFNQVECCIGDGQRFMPNFAARMWMRDAKGGIVAALYGPSANEFQVDGATVKVEEQTEYPFGETITFRFAASKPAKVPFTFRIPGWCTRPAVWVNGNQYDGMLKPGTFVSVNLDIKDAATVKLSLPMQAKILPWLDYGVYVERGPILYALAVPEKVATDMKLYDNIGGKKFVGPDFPALDLRPNGPWNYALAAASAKSLKVVKAGKKGYPFDPGNAPLVIRVPAKLVKNWTLVENRYTPPVPKKGSFQTEKADEWITLVPYGSTRLRLAVFPQAD